MQKLFILLISLISIQLVAMEKLIEEENLDSYYIYYSFKKDDHIRAFTYMIESYEPCIQPFHLLQDTNHPYNLTDNIFPLQLFLTDDFFRNPEFKLIAHAKNTNDYGEHHFHFYTKTGKTIKEVIEEKIQLFEQTHFPPYDWFSFEEKNPTFKEYVTELLNAEIIEVDKKTFKYTHGPKSWITKKKEAAAAAKFLEDKENVVLNRIKTYTMLDTQKINIGYLLLLQRR